MLKVYTGLQGAVEVDLYEVCYEIDIIKGRFMETVGVVYAPQGAVNIFFKIFSDARLYSLYLDKYVFLKTRVILREDRYKKEREMAIRQKLLKISEAVLYIGEELYVMEENGEDSDGEDEIEV